MRDDVLSQCAAADKARSPCIKFYQRSSPGQRRTRHRVRGVSADSDAGRSQNIGMMSPLVEIPGDIVVNALCVQQLGYFNP